MNICTKSYLRSHCLRCLSPVIVDDCIDAVDDCTDAVDTDVPLVTEINKFYLQVILKYPHLLYSVH